MTILEQQAVDAVNFYTQLANKKHGLNMQPFKVEFTAKGRTAGCAMIGCHTIKLNSNTLALNPERFLKRTLGHEVAHFVIHYLYEQRCATMRFPPPKPKAHGKEWLSVMMSFGIVDNSATNTYKTKAGEVTQVKQPSITFGTQHGMARTIPSGRIVEFD